MSQQPLDYQTPSAHPKPSAFKYRWAARVSAAVAAFNALFVVGVFAAPGIGEGVAFVGVPFGNLALILGLLAYTPVAWRAGGPATAALHAVVSILAPLASAFVVVLLVGSRVAHP